MRDAVVKLLTVEDRFNITGRGLVLAPHFSLPPDGRFRRFSEQVLIVRPSEDKEELAADFEAMHFRLLDGRGKWAIIVLLPHAEKEDVPIGSQIYCSARAKSILFGTASVDELPRDAH